jgi:DNA-binding transcriptional ArsR family regulator
VTDLQANILRQLVAMGGEAGAGDIAWALGNMEPRTVGLQLGKLAREGYVEGDEEPKGRLWRVARDFPEALP